MQQLLICRYTLGCRGELELIWLVLLDHRRQECESGHLVRTLGRLHAGRGYLCILLLRRGEHLLLAVMRHVWRLQLRGQLALLHGVLNSGVDVLGDEAKQTVRGRAARRVLVWLLVGYF